MCRQLSHGQNVRKPRFFPQTSHSSNLPFSLVRWKGGTISPRMGAEAGVLCPAQGGSYETAEIHGAAAGPFDCGGSLDRLRHRCGQRCRHCSWQRRQNVADRVRLGKPGAGTYFRGLRQIGGRPHRDDLPGFFGHHAPAGGGGAALRCGVARQFPVAGRGGHLPQLKARRIRFHHPGGVRHPAEPGSGAGPCGKGGFGGGPAGAHPRREAAVLHDQRHPVQLRGQRLHRVPLRPAGQPGIPHIRRFGERTPPHPDDRTPLRGGPFLRQFRLAEGHVPPGGL